MIEGTHDGPSPIPDDATTRAEVGTEVGIVPVASVGVVAAAEAGSDPPSGHAPGLLSAGGRRHAGRFLLVYAMLGAVALASIGVFVGGFAVNTIHPAAAWSAWSPPQGSTAQVASSIATHVAKEYRLNPSGAQLLGVEAEPLIYSNGTHKLTISAVAVRKKANSNTGIVFDPTSGTYADLLCGLGTSCSIASGQATDLRGRLVRREALELALYTFKFAPSVSSLVTYMPPAPGSTASTLLYFQKANLTQQLSQPLNKTLRLAQPPLPTAADPTESATIDKLTLPHIYNYSLAALQDGSLALVLDPIAA